MNIFATKDGKIYKVSMLNFINATGKRAPYYKRTEKGGKVHENGYALCPGCNNPVHFVNLFNNTKTRKRKKAHVRHQRSSIKGLADYNSYTYGLCPFSSKNTKSSKEPSTSEGPIGSFGNVISEAFGLSKESSNLLGKIYFLLKNQDPENAEHDFFALIASASYNSPNIENPDTSDDEFSVLRYIIGLAWNMGADIKNDEQRTNRLVSLGIADSDINDLINELREQHGSLEDESKPYYKKPDFTHLSATVATMLNSDMDKDFFGLVTGTQSANNSADANTGYLGDLCIADGTEPSMNDGDYKSDLDAVNIATLIKSSPNVSLLAAVGEYYSAIEAGRINRAQLFKYNIGLETLKSQRNTYYTHLRSIISLDEAVKESRIALFDKFIDCVGQEKEEWPDE